MPPSVKRSTTWGSVRAPHERVRRMLYALAVHAYHVCRSRPDLDPWVSFLPARFPQVLRSTVACRAGYREIRTCFRLTSLMLHGLLLLAITTRSMRQRHSSNDDDGDAGNTYGETAFAAQLLMPAPMPPPLGVFFTQGANFDAGRRSTRIRACQIGTGPAGNVSDSRLGLNSARLVKTRHMQDRNHKCIDG